MRKDINEEDFEPNDPNRVCGVGDRYRSEYLTIYRDVDEQGQPIYDAEYYGYDEGDPEDPNDDNYIYLIRRYRLGDYVSMSESKDASEGLAFTREVPNYIASFWIKTFFANLKEYSNATQGVIVLSSDNIYKAAYDAQMKARSKEMETDLKIQPGESFLFYIGPAHGYYNGHLMEAF